MYIENISSLKDYSKYRIYVTRNIGLGYCYTYIIYSDGNYVQDGEQIYDDY